MLRKLAHLHVNISIVILTQRGNLGDQWSSLFQSKGPRYSTLDWQHQLYPRLQNASTRTKFILQLKVKQIQYREIGRRKTPGWASQQGKQSYRLIKVEIELWEPLKLNCSWTWRQDGGGTGKLAAHRGGLWHLVPTRCLNTREEQINS